ncbi:hypothetical protein CORC01_02816 [Colletotrichum orchidophilum]|uniref:ABM domain-containing protein n=1 Tax=Colletotrichum orchidophilum TaxID=1209926 RepID=A0A1G4BKV9_9PEZI|nr:uncharacterized protein CORC01_02816 [Colletotrichum orchidophilum]OHF01938.1 hypothetical protein CORC01_02816 [Colletotrichum orchidophilum]
MSSPMIVTELGPMGVKPGLDIMDESTPEGQIFLGVYRKIIAAPGAPHRLYLGLELEDPSLVWGFFDWDSVEDHKKFAKEYGEELTKDLSKVLAYGEFGRHVTATPTFSDALKSSVTDVFIIYYPSDITAESKMTATTRLQEILEEAFGQVPDVSFTSYGWSIENDVPVKGGDPIQTGTILSAFIGWSTLEANNTFRQSEAYRQIESKLENMDGAIKLRPFRLSCTVLEKTAQ